MTGRRKSNLNRVPTIAVDHRIAPQILGGILEAVNEIGWRIIDYKLSGELENDSALLAGVIVNNWFENPSFKTYVDEGLPVIAFWHMEADARLKSTSVLPDYSAIATLAATHFSDRGLRHVGYIGRDPWGNHKEFYLSFNEEATRRGCESHLLRLKGKFADKVNSTESSEFSNWLESVSKPIGILAPSDQFAAATCRACIRLGWGVPDQISILGVGNDRFFCKSSPVPLSTIDLDDARRGREAVRVLFDILSGKADVPEQLFIPPKGLIERRSTVPDSLVTRIQRFLQDNLQFDLSVAEISDEFGVSRRKIERAFRKQLDTSVIIELRRMRLERCRELLKTSNLQIKEIAYLVGYSSTNYLHRVFRQDVGLSPIEFRKKYQG